MDSTEGGHEMDVRPLQSTPYPPPRFAENPEVLGLTMPGTQKPEMSSSLAREESISQKVREEVIMNLQEVQNFLYMMIGSKIRIESDASTTGNAVNTAV
jgi:hypothetical protein